jgi:hypothetical protein
MGLTLNFHHISPIKELSLEIVLLQAAPVNKIFSSPRF